MLKQRKVTYCWILLIEVFFVHREVTFREDIFPFQSTGQKQCQLFSSIAQDLIEENLDTTSNIYVSSLQNSSVILDVSPTSTQFANMRVASTHNDTPSPTSVVTTPVIITIQCLLGRRSCKGKQPPVWMKDFVSLSINDNMSYALSKYISYDHVSPKYQYYLSQFSNIVESTFYAEAIKDPRWVEAMKAKILALESNKTWTVVSLPKGKKPIGLNGYIKLSINLLETWKDSKRG